MRRFAEERGLVHVPAQRWRTHNAPLQHGTLPQCPRAVLKARGAPHSPWYCKVYHNVAAGRTAPCTPLPDRRPRSSYDAAKLGSHLPASEGSALGCAALAVDVPVMPTTCSRAHVHGGQHIVCTAQRQQLHSCSFACRCTPHPGQQRTCVRFEQIMSHSAVITVPPAVHATRTLLEAL